MGWFEKLWMENDKWTKRLRNRKKLEKAILHGKNYYVKLAAIERLIERTPADRNHPAYQRTQNILGKLIMSVRTLSVEEMHLCNAAISALTDEKILLDFAKTPPEGWGADDLCAAAIRKITDNEAILKLAVSDHIGKASSEAIAERLSDDWQSLRTIAVHGNRIARDCAMVKIRNLGGNLSTRLQAEVKQEIEREREQKRQDVFSRIAAMPPKAIKVSEIMQACSDRDVWTDQKLSELQRYASDRILAYALDNPDDYVSNQIRWAMTVQPVESTFMRCAIELNWYEEDARSILRRVDDPDKLLQLAREAKSGYIRWKACKKAGGHRFDDGADPKRRCFCTQCGIEEHVGAANSGRPWVCERCGATIEVIPFVFDMPSSTLRYTDGTERTTSGYRGHLSRDDKL